MSFNALPGGGAGGAEDLPEQASFFHFTAKPLTGNLLALLSITLQAWAHVSEQSPAADADSFEQKVLLKPGNYKLHVIGTSGMSGGKIDWYLDNVLFHSAQDWYRPFGTLLNVKKTTSTVAVATISNSDIHILKGIVNGKDISSAGHKIPITKYSFEKI